MKCPFCDFVGTEGVHMTAHIRFTHFVIKELQGEK